MRDYDLVLFGASGFTGRLTAEYLARAAAERPLRWAIAGRDRGKLEAVAAAIAEAGFAPPAQLSAAVDQLDSLRTMAASARVLATTVGPFDRYGDGVVEACVREGCHYLDITGEPSFVARTIERWHTAAESAGLKLVSCCGFDSVPHDLGAFLAVRRLPAGEKIVLEAFVEVDAKFSGGTWQSAVNAFAHPGRRSAGKVASPEGRRVRGFQQRPHYEKRVAQWVAPMPTIDPFIVLRSAAGLPEYGPDFRYSHNLCAGSFFELAKLAAGVGGAIALAQLGPTRRWLESLQPSGSGPSPARRARSHFAVHVFGRAESGAEVRARVAGGDPGYTETSKMLAESALCLVYGEDRPDRAGALTPVLAFGDALVARLRRAGMKLEADAVAPEGRE